MRLAISTTETLTDLKTDLVVANNNNCTHICITLSPLDLWTDHAGVTALLTRWTESLLVDRKREDRTLPTSRSWEGVNNADTSLSTSYRPISLLCPAAKDMEALLLPTGNNHLLPSADQHGSNLSNMRQTISYKLHMCQVKGKDSPHWRYARLEDVIQFLSS